MSHSLNIAIGIVIGCWIGVSIGNWLVPPPETCDRTSRRQQRDKG